MAKGKLYVLIGALAIGILAALNQLHSKSDVSLCKISLNPEAYNNQNVEITANLYSYSTGVMHVNGIECGPRSDAWATLDLDSSFLPTTINEPFLENIRNVERQDEYKLAEVRLVGRIEDLERQCFGPRFVLYVTHIEQLSEISIHRLEDDMK